MFLFFNVFRGRGVFLEKKAVVVFFSQQQAAAASILLYYFIPTKLIQSKMKH